VTDEIHAELGDNADVAAVGKKNTQQAQTVTVTGDNSGNQWLIAQILDHGAQIRELTYRLDDIPNQFIILKADVKRLQDVEITVRPSEVVIKPVTPPDASYISMRALLIAMIVGFLIVLIMVALLYWRSNG